MNNNSTESAQRTTTKDTPKSKGRVYSNIPVDDLLVVLEEKSSIQILWKECWAVDPFGNRWVEIKTRLGKSAFASARQVLKRLGMFEFKADSSTADNRKTSRWLVKNLHGSRFSIEKDNKPKENLESTAEDLEPMIMDLESTKMDCISSETLTPQASCNPSLYYSVSNTINKQEKLNQPIENKYVDLEIPTDPVIGTNSYKVEKNPPADSLMVGEVATLDATQPNEIVEEKDQEPSLSPEELRERQITLANELTEVVGDSRRVRLWINEGTVTQELVVLDLTEQEYEGLRVCKREMSLEEFESYKLAILDEIPDAIIARFPARITHKALQPA